MFCFRFNPTAKKPFNYIQFLAEFYFVIDNFDIFALDQFIDKYIKSDIDHLAQFAKGLKKDYDAVKNSIIYPHISNGPIEGTKQQN